MSKIATRAFFLVVAAVGLALRVLFLINTPIDQPAKIGELSCYGDERAHVEYTRQIIETGRLPRSASAITKEAQTPDFENYQSPAYYVVHAGVCAALGIRSLDGITICGRLLSFIAGLILILVAWKLLIALGGRTASVEWAILFSFLALSGVFVRFTTLAGNDAFFWVSLGFCCYYLVRTSSDFRARTTGLLAFWLIIAIYCKLSALLFVPAVLFHMFRARGASRRHLPLFIGAFALLVPLFYRNLHDFGSLLPLTSGFGKPSWRLPDAANILFAIRSSIFPWSELWSNWLGLALMLPALVFLFIFSLRWLRRASIGWPVILTAVSVLAYIALNLQYDQAEARYMFVAWPALIPLIQSATPRHKSLPIAFATALCLPYALFIL